jgi:AP-1-like factor
LRAFHYSEQSILYIRTIRAFIVHISVITNHFSAMSQPNFRSNQSFLDSLHPSYDKDLNENILSIADPLMDAEISSLLQTTTPFDLTDNLSNILSPSLDSKKTPESSLDSLSFSSQSPIFTTGNTDLLVADSSPTVSTSEQIASLWQSSEVKRKASIVPGAEKASKVPKPAPKKAGRKADPVEPANKRKAQNRAAQRAFRERKEKHLKDLEDKITELESESRTVNTENDFLRQQVKRLQKELNQYRAARNTPSSINSTPASSGQFTFEFPFFQRTVFNQQNKKARSNSGDSSGSSSILSPSSNADSSSSVSSNSPHEKLISTPSCSTLQKGEETFCEQLNLACGTRLDPIPKAPTSISDNAPLIISALPDDNSLSQNKPLNIMSPPMFELDFLSEYRDPIFEPESFSLPDLTTEASIFDPLKPVKQEQSKQQAESELQETVPANSNKLMTCTAVWDRISAHPKFGELDIDGLCAELRTKAKCSETGAVLSENDVNKVLSTLESRTKKPVA